MFLNLLFWVSSSLHWLDPGFLLALFVKWSILGTKLNSPHPVFYILRKLIFKNVWLSNENSYRCRRVWTVKISIFKLAESGKIIKEHLKIKPALHHQKENHLDYNSSRPKKCYIQSPLCSFWLTMMSQTESIRSS